MCDAEHRQIFFSRPQAQTLEAGGAEDDVTRLRQSKVYRGYILAGERIHGGLGCSALPIWDTPINDNLCAAWRGGGRNDTNGI